MSDPQAAAEIDRVAPSRRPDRRCVMRQSWSSLLFLHWEVPTGVIGRLLPSGLEVDTFDGRAYVGLVPFAMSGVRPVGLPAVPWLSNFLEVNVRTYVRREGRDPGVWFFSLDAANPVAVWLARNRWHLPYHWASMRQDVEPGPGRVIDYRSRRRGPGIGPGCRIRYRPTGTPAPAAPGSLEFFLVERYLLYAEARGRLGIGRVHHAPYPVQQAEVLVLEEDLIASSSIERPDRPPLVHFAAGVTVEIFPIEWDDRRGA